MSLVLVMYRNVSSVYHLHIHMALFPVWKDLQWQFAGWFAEEDKRRCSPGSDEDEDGSLPPGRQEVFLGPEPLDQVALAAPRTGLWLI